MMLLQTPGFSEQASSSHILRSACQEYPREEQTPQGQAGVSEGVCTQFLLPFVREISLTALFCLESGPRSLAHPPYRRWE